MAARSPPPLVGIRLDGPTLTLFDLDTRELLRSHVNPLTPVEVLRSVVPARRQHTRKTVPVHVGHDMITIALYVVQRTTTTTQPFPRSRLNNPAS